MGSALQRAQTILGHAPTGLAQTIVKSGVLVVVNDGDYQPQSYVDSKTKQLAGFDVDVAKAVAAILGLSVKWTHATVVQVPAGLKSGSCDVAIDSLPITQGQTSIAFTKPYYYTLGEVFTQKGGVLVTGPSGLAGKTVGVAIDSVFYEYLEGAHHGDCGTIHDRRGCCAGSGGRDRRVLDDGSPGGAWRDGDSADRGGQQAALPSGPGVCYQSERA